jgi:hypothetical protein
MGPLPEHSTGSTVRALTLLLMLRRQKNAHHTGGSRFFTSNIQSIICVVAFKCLSTVVYPFH